MKKLFVIAAAILSFGIANAQIVAYAGFQDVTETTKQGGHSHSEGLSGLVLGGAMNFDISNGIGVQPGVELTTASRTDNGVKYSQLGLRVPIDVNYGFEIAPDFKLFVFAGPSIYLGLSSKAKWDDDSYDYYEDDFSRFGLGLSTGAWCDWKDMLRLKLGYDLGLTNRYKRDSDISVKESAFMVTVGYLF